MDNEPFAAAAIKEPAAEDIKYAVALVELGWLMSMRFGMNDEGALYLEVVMADAWMTAPRSAKEWIEKVIAQGVKEDESA